MFYVYRQNNSGGIFDVDESKGVGHKVFIEANSESEARNKALSIGIYFDGVDSGEDCDCCGDRWYDSPDTVSVISRQDLSRGIFGDQYFIHYGDGSVEHVDGTREDRKAL